MIFAAALPQAPIPGDVAHVTYQDFALAMHAPRPVSGPHVVDVKISPKGRFAFIFRERRPADDDAPFQPAALSDYPHVTEVEVRDFETGKSFVGAVAPAFSTVSLQAAWTSRPGHGAILLSAAEAEPGLDGARVVHRYIPLNAFEGRSRPPLSVAGQELGPYPRLYAAPDAEAVALVGQRVLFADDGSVAEETFLFRSFDARGSETQRAALPRETSGPLRAAWVGPALNLSVEREGKPAILVFNTATGQAQIDDADLAEPTPDPVRLEPVQSQVKLGGKTEPITSLWLVSDPPTDEPRALAAADADFGVLSPALDRLLYVTDGQLFERRISQMTLARFRELRYARIQEVAMKEARDVARAALLYWRDHGQIYPEPDVFAETVMHLAREDSSFDRYVAIYPGGPIRPGQNTATTTLGFIDATIGRATIMLDGSIRWEYRRIG